MLLNVLETDPRSVVQQVALKGLLVLVKNAASQYDFQVEVLEFSHRHLG